MNPVIQTSRLSFRASVSCALQAFFVREAWHDLQTFAMLRGEWQKRVG